ncbi:NB-ARC domain-containing protein [Streptomyces sp. NPDC092296]|uniref:NB-ARC domain-containing protein n=1 Tax=Streptomyces sp. NPDC092296 TaxID=3366012 RepID=UPI00380A0850
MARVALFSASVLSSAADGRRLPTLQVALGYVRACDGDLGEWERRWRSVARECDVEEAEKDGPLGAVERPADGAALRARQRDVGVPRPAQLPLGPDELIGRGAERAWALGLMRSRRGTRVPLIVSGRIGVGKTAFVLVLAREMSADFPDGQLYLDLGADEMRDVPVSQIMASALRALAVPPEKIPHSTGESAALFRSILSSRRILVVLDNAQGEQQILPFLVEALCSQILVTGRARMLGLDGVARMDVGTLGRPDAVALIQSIAGPERTRTEWEPVVQIAELCDDLPVALSIVGKQLAAHPCWTPVDALRYLREGEGFVANLQVGELSLRGRLAAAYGPLSRRAKVALRYVSERGSAGVYPGDLAEVPGIGGGSPVLVLETLVDAGFLGTATGSRYTMSPLLRSFVFNHSGLAGLGA